VPILLDTGAVELLRRRNRQVETLVVRQYPPLICRSVFAEFLYGQLLAEVDVTHCLRLRNFSPISNVSILTTPPRSLTHGSVLS
jgi:hypothetical protein